MKEIKTTNQFLRDLKLARKRGKDIRKIEAVIKTLARDEKLSLKHRPHRLQGAMKGFRAAAKSGAYSSSAAAVLTVLTVLTPQSYLK